MIFRRGGRKKIECKQDKDEIEKIKKWKYLGIWMRNNSNREELVMKTVKKAVRVIKQV